MRPLGWLRGLGGRVRSRCVGIRALQDENARLRNENAGLARQVYEMQEKNAQATMSAQRELELESVIEALHHEKEDLYERLKAADVAKSTGEQSFRIFSRRLRTMQEQLNSAHEETETIRAELRRMQYEAPNAPISNGDGFFREKLEEVQSENAALRRMVEEMRHDTTTDAGHPTTPSSRISTAPPSRVPSAFTSRTHSPALSRAKSMSVTAWDQHPYTRQDSSPYATSPYATTATSPYATTSPTDHQRRSFAEKMRLYESDPHLPAVAAAPLTASSSPRMSPRMSASVLSADNPFANPGRRAEVAGGVYTAHKGRAGHTGEAWADGHSPGHGFSPAKGNTLAGGTPVTPTPPAAQNGYLQTRDELNRELAALAATKAAVRVWCFPVFFSWHCFRDVGRPPYSTVTPPQSCLNLPILVLVDIGNEQDAAHRRPHAAPERRDRGAAG
ncbi:uncharacterized protein EV422DRAFT_257978 [Fimicolochytrium jonesii]|uniref:uncharacterized protein n=1 Tax=Fimicolochytrium jonesii TaxID=1396493 RepID=UPI0022FDE938|nr:uncharacterized protein EV422DRAFT_257978 [Fimicolochytrium jonesii]KAI8817171.1 hypothetical protein EV422DRAFT_257978 [Fimicolochytrium jonesii]